MSDVEQNEWCKCVRMTQMKINRLVRELVSLKADEDWVPLRNIFSKKDKAQAMFELMSLANCYDLIRFRTATRAFTRSEKNFACIPSGTDIRCVSHVKFEPDWREKLRKIEKRYYQR